MCVCVFWVAGLAKAELEERLSALAHPASSKRVGASHERRVGTTELFYAVWRRPS